MKKLEINLDLLSIVFAGAVVLAFVLLVTLTGRVNAPELTFTLHEQELIESSDSLMRVLSVEDPADLAVLRSESSFLTEDDIRSELFHRLSGLMVSTMTDPSQDGVGIAAPQVGILKRIVAVQRFDKEGEPVEVYPDIRIDRYAGDVVPGVEGCLSVPGYRGSVPRYQEISISYRDPETLDILRDTVSGFTAVIFQHEVDHLDGILYTDRADSLYVAAD